MQDKFNKIIEKQKLILEKNKRRYKAVGYGKLILFILLAGLIYSTVKNEYDSLFLLCTFAVFAAFVYLWICQNKIKEKVDFSVGIISINEKNIDRVSGEWVNFKDVGSEFIDSDHRYALDLDVVGEKSLFQFLNSTNTWYGRSLFARDLLGVVYSASEIEQRQHAISELADKLDFSNEIEYEMSRIGTSESVKSLVKDLQDDKTYLNNDILKNLISIVPIIGLICLLCGLIFGINYGIYVGVICLIQQGITWAIGFSKTARYLAPVTNLPCKLIAYNSIIKTIKAKEFESAKLNEIKSLLSTSESSAEHAMKELAAITDKVSVRGNFLVYFALNISLLWDFRCALKLQKWKKKYASYAEEWFIALGELESLLSFANLPRVCSNVSVPEICQDSKIVKGRKIGHPLLNNKVRVNNSFDCEDSIYIISGSNMSGKTTFLRTVGINLVLAQCGSLVCAKDMKCSPLAVVTSMRIADDLSAGISTFYAEIKRIKRIIDAAEKSRNTIFLIDEIFRGTNSVDRLFGAVTVIEKLNNLDVTGIITTHDLELCQLEEKYNRIKNYHFSESYSDKEIHFDYKMKEGKSTTTNGKYLMEMVGILEAGDDE